MLLALSGGADSVYLLLYLLAQGTHPTAIHVNHALRGAESDADEAFVRTLCAEKHIPLLVYRAHPPANASEDWAREARYAFFREAAEATGDHTIALAHHRDDQAETLLMHLMRGAGLSGLTGMARESTVDGLTILRPLLDMGREEIREELRRRGQSWREDSSNQDTKYLRNAIRRDIMPRLESLIPGAGRRMASTAFLLQEDARVLDGMAADILGESRPWLPVELLASQPEALQSRILRRWGEMHAHTALTQPQTRAAMAALTSPAGTKANLPGGLQIYKGWTHVHLLGGHPERPENRLITEEFTGATGDGKRTQVIPRRMIEQATLRTRQAGDFIRPFGSAGRQSLQDYLVNRHIDAPFRDMVPLLCEGSEVLMAFGVGASERLRADTTQDNILLRMEGELPWHRQAPEAHRPRTGNPVLSCALRLDF